jgi:membrane-associated phospholipid phosphatase
MKTGYLPKRYRLPFVLALMGIGFFVVSWLAANNGTINGNELHIFRFFNDAPTSLVALFMFITFFGTLPALLGVGAALIVLRKYNLALQVLFGGSLTWFLANAFKFAGVRQRPYDLLPNVHLAETRDATWGFPSAHSALITAIIIVLLLNSKKKLYWLLMVAVVLVGLSRIIVGMHAPLDVTGGIGLGLTLGCLMKLLFLKYMPNQKTA